MAKLAFIGLGVMGAPIAGHLAKAGHDMTVFNRTRSKAEAWSEQYGGTIAPTPAAAAEGADAVFSCVAADGDLEAVTMRTDGCFRSMRKGALFIDHSSVSARLARQLAVEGKDRGLLVIDAPVTGAEIGAKDGTLSIMCGGAAKAVNAAIPIMEAYAKHIVHVGGPGTGQQTKMVNQIALATTNQAIAEALHFAQHAGLDLDKVFEVISTGAASSWTLLNRWKTMNEKHFDFGFPAEWMRKDLSLAIEEARSNGAALPVAGLVDQFYAEILSMYGNREDMSALILRLPPVKHPK